MGSANSKRTVSGFIFITIGLIFLLKNLGFDIDLPNYLFSWPAIFVAIGLVNLLLGKGRVALIFFGMALIFYLQYFDIINLRAFWPVILIIIGLSFILKKPLFKDRT